MLNFFKEKRRRTLVERIHELYQQDKLAEDTPELVEYMELAPESYFPYFYLGEIKSKQQDYAEAFEAYRKAEEKLIERLERQPQNLGLIIKLREHLIGTAVRHYKKHPPEEHKTECVEQLIRDGYDDGLLYFVLAEDAWFKDNYKDVKKRVDAAIKHDLPESLYGDAYLLRGLSNIYLDDLVSGEADLQQALNYLRGKKRKLTEEYLAGLRERKDQDFTFDYNPDMDDN